MQLLHESTLMLHLEVYLQKCKLESFVSSISFTPQFHSLICSVLSVLIFGVGCRRMNDECMCNWQLSFGWHGVSFDRSFCNHTHSEYTKMASTCCTRIGFAYGARWPSFNAILNFILRAKLLGLPSMMFDSKSKNTLEKCNYGACNQTSSPETWFEVDFEPVPTHPECKKLKDCMIDSICRTWECTPITH